MLLLPTLPRPPAPRSIALDEANPGAWLNSKPFPGLFVSLSSHFDHKIVDRRRRIKYQIGTFAAPTRSSRVAETELITRINSLQGN